MKSPLLLGLAILTSALAYGQAPFPGLKAVLTESEWRRAGLDRLSVDEIGVIEAALIRHQKLTTPTLQIEVNQARQQPTVVASPIATASAADNNRTLLQKFGLPFTDTIDWRTVPPLRAKVVSWEGGNRFKLDNGQIWEGTEPITYALPGKEIEIQARPSNRYALIVEGGNTTIRVVRLQ